MTRTRPAGGKFYGRAKPGNTCSDNNEISVDTLNGGGDIHMVQREHMPTFEVRTAQHTYLSIVERGMLQQTDQFHSLKGRQGVCGDH